MTAVDRQSFRARFSRPLASISRRTDRINTKRLVGTGTLTIAGDVLRIDGKRHRSFWLGAPVVFEVPLSQLLNVHGMGRAVRFEVHPPSEQPWTVTCELDDASAVVRLLHLLPKSSTEAFQKSMAELKDYQDRLSGLATSAVVTPTLVAINIAVFGVLALAGAGLVLPNPGVMVRWGSNFGPLTAGGQWWRLLSSMFMHFGLLHLALNCWALYTSGRLVERVFGSVRFLILYLFAGLAGGLASVLWHPVVNSAGASGAIFGIFGALLAFLLRPGNRLPAAVVQQQLGSTIAFIGYNLFFGATHSGIDNSAHIGGLLGGFVMGFLLAQPIDAEARRKASPLVVPAVLAAGVAALAGGIMLAANASPARLQQRAVFMGMYWADEHEDAALKSLNTFLKAASSHQLPERDIPDQIDKIVLPPWQAMRDHVAATPASTDSSLYAIQQAYLQYLDHRIEALQDYAAGVRDKDHDKVKAGNALIEGGKADIDAIQKARKAMP